jgi:hypothetical protein
MKSTSEQINKIVSREPKVQNGGMPSRNTETHSPTANCYATIPSGNNVKATVNKVLSKIK